MALKRSGRGGSTLPSSLSQINQSANNPSVNSSTIFEVPDDGGASVPPDAGPINFFGYSPTVIHRKKYVDTVFLPQTLVLTTLRQAGALYRTPVYFDAKSKKLQPQSTYPNLLLSTLFVEPLETRIATAYPESFPIQRRVNRFENPTFPNLLTSTLAVGGTTYTINPSGGFVLSGTALQLRERVYSPIGSVNFTGTNTFIRQRQYSISGSIAFSGTAPFSTANTYVITPTGSITYSGTVVILHDKTYAPSGNITYAGTNTFIRQKTYAPTGTITFTGAPLIIKENVIQPTGNITFSGSSAITFVPFGTPTVTTYLALTGVGK
jgi:hypothetical protein